MDEIIISVHCFHFFSQNSSLFFETTRYACTIAAGEFSKPARDISEYYVNKTYLV